MRISRDTFGGRWIDRPDGEAKVTGELAYLTDRHAPGMLYGKVLRSKHAHALLLSVDVTNARALPGVQAVLTAEDVPGWNGYGIVCPDYPVFCTERVRHRGDAIAAVAADSPELAEAALQLIEVLYEPLPVVDDPMKAMEPDSPLLHPEGNVLHRTTVDRGDAEAAFKACAYIVEEQYETPRQLHLYMETEGGLFVPEGDGRLTVYSATQHGYKDRMQLARILAMEEERIRVVSSPIGGSFGGKDELNVQPYGALLALKTGRPVKLHNSRRESMQNSIKRHPMHIRMKTGVDASGKLLAHQAVLVADTGAYTTLGREVLIFATEHASGPYLIPNVDVKGMSVFTNNGVAGEFRGFGGNQVIFAIEGQMDRLAEKLGMDPWQLRSVNLRDERDPGPLGQLIVPTNGARQVWERAMQSPLMARRGLRTEGGDPWCLRGIGAALVMHGGGLGFGIPDPAGGKLKLSQDGKLEAYFGFEEFGQGIYSVLTLLMREHTGCSADDVRIMVGDTDVVPHTGSATASRSTAMAWEAMRRLCPPFIEQLISAAAACSGESAASLHTGQHGVWKQLPDGTAAIVMEYRELAASIGKPITVETAFEFPVTPSGKIGAHFLYTYTSVVAEVEVNQLTGEIRVLAADHAVAAGPVVNPVGYLGQIEGGGVMGQGFALTEEVVMQGGEYARSQLDTYMIPTICDIPRKVTVEAIEELPAGDAFGPRGVGEIGTTAIAPAIAAAVKDATGRWISKLPISPEQLIRSI
ncbi:xanthine dehydrogenase subunit D [Paenibacillus sp. GCM10023252]|uniref:xanthine dehydrogenase subunit D n=1 Tax=Paenibacillus sp. GCM10023252 TaxID=3252649 RepID=UPI0036209CB3